MAATVAAAATLTLAPAALAETAPVTGVELGTSVQKSVAVNARFDFTEAYTVGLPQLKKLRGEMWDQNVPFNKTTLRAAAAAHGLTTKEAYVNAVQIDPDLTRIAVQRAAEQPVNGVGTTGWPRVSTTGTPPQSMAAGLRAKMPRRGWTWPTRSTTAGATASSPR